MYTKLTNSFSLNNDVTLDDLEYTIQLGCDFRFVARPLARFIL